MRLTQALLPTPPFQPRRVFIASGIVLAALSLLLCSSGHAAGTGLFHTLPPDTPSLEQYRWHHRPLIVFAPSEKDASYVRQMALLKKTEAELAERDIVVLSDTSPAAKGQLRSQLKPEGFEIVLVGKDGGIKLREKTPLSSDVLFSTIDSMPMRKADLR